MHAAPSLVVPRTTLVTLTALASLAACGDDAGPAAPDAAVDPDPRFDDGVMRIDVRSQTFGNGNGDTAVSAVLSTTPWPWPYDGPTTDGACRLWRRRDVDNCAPACPSTSMCDDGTCRPLPVPRSAGTLTIGGGGERRVIPFQDGYQLYVPEPLFAAGTELTASAPGDDLPGFSLTAALPAELVLVDAATLVLAQGSELTFRWVPAGDDSRIRVTLGADLGHAQWRSIVVECDLPDAAGQVQVPQAMVDVLADPQHWSCGDCFGQDVRRYRRADTSLDGTSLTLWAFQSQSVYLRPEP